MSGSTAKQERRDLRRAFGESAIGVIDKQGQAIATLSDDIREAFAQHKAHIDRLQTRLDALDQELTILTHELQQQRDDFRTHRAAAWTDRLRWVMAGA